MEKEKTVIFDNAFTDCVKDYRTLTFEADVINNETSEVQKRELDELCGQIAAKYQISDINSIPAIAATRRAYKACGKDPNRYRPSQEQMMRRIVKGLGLYNVNALVDAGNELSLRTGCSVGCFDADKIEGDRIVLGVGRTGEPYEGIGRGVINIEGMPVFRDDKGGIGSPTSDNVRTMLSLETRHMFVTVHLFEPAVDENEVIRLFKEIFVRYGKASNIKSKVYRI